MRVLLLVLAFIAVCVLSQTPPVPKWPSTFSASIFITHHDRREFPSFHRWYYDSVQNKDRFDGVEDRRGELFWAERIFDHQANKEWVLFFQRDLVVCHTRPINWTLPKPNFANFQYIGKALIDDHPVYHWIENDRQRERTYQYFNLVSNGNPKRIDIDDRRERRAETWVFHEFDSCPQDPFLYTVPKIIESTCTPY
eukprot:TRINITY_DN1459_c0_g1_i2.p1 TRINITY_DN1459_c0_g1~~TRINITY_DN1459_c0_g1_i2.p1  ORF type:complete len:196 (-),score=33.68 TRINITY_DN1459_c0_g1_i2:119-706(-)